MKNIKIIFFLFMPFMLVAQDDFEILESKGRLPKEVVSKLKIEYDRDRVITGKIANNFERKNSEEFLNNQSNYINRVFKSGQLFFGESLSDYINDIAEYIFSKNPDLDDDVKFYVENDPSVNARSLHKGYVFVNLGLLAQVENEAQLAYILCHELIHYYKKHGIDYFLERQLILNRKGEYKDLIFSDERTEKLVEILHDHEFESDLDGLKEIYANLDYNIEEVPVVYDILLYSYLPFDEQPFDSAEFDDENYTLPESYFSNNLKPITAVEDYDDEKSTHPNIKRRREKMYDLAVEIDNGGGDKFVVSEEEFYKVRKLSRYQLCQNYLDNMDYGKAYYSAYMLAKNDPESEYLRRIKAYSLYGMSKYRNFYSESVNKDISEHTAKKYNQGLLDTSSVEGHSYQLFNVVNSMTSKELNVIALRENIKIYLDFPEVKFYQNIVESCIEDLVRYHDIDEKSIENEITKDTFEYISDKEYEELSKYAKIKYNRKKDSYEKGNIDNKVNNMLVVYSENENIINMIKEAVIKIENEEKEDEEDEENEEEKDKFIYKSKNRLEKNKSIIVFNPFTNFKKKMSNTDAYPDGKYNYIKSEDMKYDVFESYKSAGKDIGLKMKILDSYTLKSDDIDEYNNIACMMRYFYEFIEIDNKAGDFELIPSNTYYINDIANEYESDYLLLSAINVEKLSMKMPRSTWFGVLYPMYFIGNAMYGSLVGNYNIVNYSYLINVRTGRIVVNSADNYSAHPSKYTYNQIIYNRVTEIKEELTEN